MKNLLILITTMVSLNTWAQADRAVEGGHFPNAVVQKNFIKNSSCDRNVNNITASGSLSVTASATTPIKGGKSCLVDATASTELATWAAVTIDKELYGQNCEARFTYYGDGSLYKAYVKLGSTQVTTSLQLIDAGSSSRPVSINYPCGDGSGAVTVVLEATGNGAAIKVDEVYAGLATNLSNVAQATLFGTLKTVACSNSWTVTNAAFTVLSTQTSCTYTATGNVSAPATMIAGFKVANLPPGEYLVTYDGAMLTPAVVGAFRFHDGTTAAREEINTTSAVAAQPSKLSGSFTYTAAQSDITFQIQAKSTSGAMEVNGTTTYPGVFKIIRFPSASELALRPNLTPSSWSGYHDDTCVWARTDTAYGDFTADASCALTQRQANNVTCVATGSVLPAIACTLPRTGMYYVCANSISAQMSTAGQAGGYKLWDGTTVIGESMGATSNTVSPMGVCGIYNATSLSPTFTVQGRSASGAINITRAAANGAASVIEWSIFQVGQNVNAPILVGGVTSPYTGSTVINSLVSKSADYTATGAEETIVVDASGATRTITLPAAASFSGKKYHIIATSSTNAVIIDGNASETVCDQTSIKLWGVNDSVEIQSDGTKWVGLGVSCTRTAGAYVSSGGTVTNGVIPLLASSSGASPYTGTYLSATFSATPVCVAETRLAGYNSSMGSESSSSFVNTTHVSANSATTSVAWVVTCTGAR